MDKYLEPIIGFLENNKEWWTEEPEFWLLQYDIVDEMKEANLGIEAVQPILSLMEKYPLVEFGTPGALTHFIEDFHGQDAQFYDNCVVQSVTRNPTVHTVWLLNRIINGTEPKKREQYIQIMRSICDNQNIHNEIRTATQNFLEDHE